ncbi:hypothetical protein HPB48_019964 [Haemaphysalis longicornis]|uniref:PX domain-containing protein n=1 Tax=Haemaphysalis longicornis TaxID=44386 RepID=A0A9J6GR77_HAELO|nr:hypothetical protein HPB48_019964 [Haemaphysalis longicornis]
MTVSDFKKPEFSVLWQHEEFIWLHDALEEGEDYAGMSIPPATPRPHFDASQEKLQKLGEGEGYMAKEEFAKMKQELEVEYIATFKKTRLALHPVFRADDNFHVFLEYEKELRSRGKNKKERLAGLLSHLGNGTWTTSSYTSAPSSPSTTDATQRADRMTRAHKNVADSYIRISSCLTQLATLRESTENEGRVATDEDFKLSDTLCYYMCDTSAAKDLLYRRLRFLANYENANRALERTCNKNKELQATEAAQQEA